MYTYHRDNIGGVNIRDTAGGDVYLQPGDDANGFLKSIESIEDISDVKKALLLKQGLMSEYFWK